MPSFPTGLQHVALYLRKSRADVEAEARGEGETLSKHRKALLKIANTYRYAIDDVYEEIVSGERIIDRPEMQRLLHAVQEYKYTAVLCMDIDRLGRGNMVDQGLIQDAFKTSKTLIITPRKVYDLQDELDEEWSEFEAFMARRELKIITRRMQRGRWQSAAEGRHIGRRPPFGYTRDENLRLQPDPETAPIVRSIFRMAADGVGTINIANYLMEQGVKTPSGNDIWERTSVWAILKNPVYRGHIRWGYERTTKTSTGTKRVKQTEEKWQLRENAHEALVDEETYQRYLDKLGKRPKIPQKKALSNSFAGLIVCAKCGKVMRRQPKHQRPHDMLLCIRPGCDTRGARFDLVEERILQTLHEVASNMVVEAMMQPEHLVQNVDDTVALAERHVHQLQNELSTAETQLGNLHDLLERGAYTVEMFVERSRVLGERIDDLKSKLADAETAYNTAQEQSSRRGDIIPQLMHVLESYDQAETAQERNDLLKMVIDRIEYRREKNWNKLDQFEIDVFLRP